jgi:hypothetical protein
VKYWYKIYSFSLYLIIVFPGQYVLTFFDYNGEIQILRLSVEKSFSIELSD